LGQIGIKLDQRRKEPLHRQIFDQVVARIEARAFPAGFKLPPSRDLARELGTHRNTVARAYTDLEEAGFVSAGVGRGTFVQALDTLRPVRVNSAANGGEQGAREMPWTSLLARSARTEVTERAQRHVRSSGRKDVINLARMQPSPDLIPDALLRRCLTHVLAQEGPAVLSYPPPQGTLRVRELIARTLVQRGVPARAEEILVTSGSQQGLDMLTRVLINPGDVVLIEPTTYSGAIDLFSLAGARLVAVPMDDQGPVPEALARFAQPDVKALYIMPNAHNPTGRTLGAERRRALVSWSQQAGVPIIEDDYAADLSLGEHTSPPSLRTLSGDVIYLSTFSKCLAPGLRLGYLVAPERLLPMFSAIKRIVDLGASPISQATLAEFIERGYLRVHMQRVRHEYRLRRDALHAALTKHMPRGVSWELPSHGVVLWLRLPDGLDPLLVYEDALAAGVLVSPSRVWSVESAEPHERALRLTFCAESSERLLEGARRLAQAIKATRARTRSEALQRARPMHEVV
jgi:DNA-binding transcriptional MocR family regulator